MLMLLSPAAANLLKSKQTGGERCDANDFDPGLCCPGLKMTDCQSEPRCSYDGVGGNCDARPTVCEQIACDGMLKCTAHFKKVFKEGACCPICEAQDSYYKLKDDPTLSRQIRNIYKFGGKKRAHE